ncbi:boophilin-G2-like [Leptopilina heterotoma]|uniref:boophilin-G2-like n=1 Tax=Leptopilina heterotoma TaxID=63436 RepID=UPI001CAA3193|nr:boophilin-G2-like [Leptopilina heterotoma]
MQLIVSHFSFSLFVLFLVQGVLSSQKAEKCFLDFDSGPDEDFTVNYWFNKTAGQCENFWYGGSGGNENRFEKLDDCINICDSDEEEVPPELLPKEVCLLKWDSGRYENWSLKFAYNQENGICEEFYYGGRGGNGNRFQTYENCIDHCEPMDEGAILQQHSKEDCLLEINNGDGADWKEYYGFDKNENKCIPFFYGGNGGNGNRFNTEKACRWFLRLIWDLPESIVDPLKSFVSKRQRRNLVWGAFGTRNGEA